MPSRAVYGPHAHTSPTDAALGLFSLDSASPRTGSEPQSALACP